MFIVNKPTLKVTRCFPPVFFPPLSLNSRHYFHKVLNIWHSQIDFPAVVAGERVKGKWRYFPVWWRRSQILSRSLHPSHVLWEIVSQHFNLDRIFHALGIPVFLHNSLTQKRAVSAPRNTGNSHLPLTGLLDATLFSLLSGSFGSSLSSTCLSFRRFLCWIPKLLARRSACGQRHTHVKRPRECSHHLRRGCSVSLHHPGLA